MLNFMLDSELADTYRATIERINSDHLTSEEQIVKVLLDFSLDGKLIILYQTASGFTNSSKSFRGVAQEKLLQFELEVLKLLYKQPAAVLVI
jgi:hypothetical protein